MNKIFIIQFLHYNFSFSSISLYLQP
jgi:hypothetical protein